MKSVFFVDIYHEESESPSKRVIVTIKHSTDEQFVNGVFKILERFQSSLKELYSGFSINKTLWKKFLNNTGVLLWDNAYDDDRIPRLNACALLPIGLVAKQLCERMIHMLANAVIHKKKNTGISITVFDFYLFESLYIDDWVDWDDEAGDSIPELYNTLQDDLARRVALIMKALVDKIPNRLGYDAIERKHYSITSRDTFVRERNFKSFHPAVRDVLKFEVKKYLGGRRRNKSARRSRGRSRSRPRS
jgi:hypothetical protein